MKRIVLITTAAGFLSQAPICPAQKPQEPAGLAAAAPEAPAATPPRTAKKPGAATTTTGAQYGGAIGMNFFTTGSRGDSIPPVMIRFSQPEAKAGAALEEDLFVMARVISRTLERAQADGMDYKDYKMNVPMLLTGSGRSVRPMYIEGLGPLFMIKVNFALLPPPKADENPVNVDATDTEWRAAQKDVFGETAGVVLDEPAGRTSSYKEDQVELLKKELVGALKNAGNIRGLQGEEFVNIAVFGHASTRGRRPGNVTADTSFADAGVNKGSVLTMRARKSDIDAFAAGKLNTETFRTKVLMTAYFGSGNGVTSINSWIQENTTRSGRLP